MRPVSAAYEINQPFGSMATAGVAPSWTQDTVGWYVRLYGNYQPFGHAGCDIACPEGTPVRAIASGTVLWADWGTNLPGDESNAGYRRRWYLYKGFPGIVTVIQHDGWVGVYAHLSQAWMNAGDTVTEGQQLGLSGGTGGVAPHLHVEALIDLNYSTGGGLIYGRTNPEPYFGSIAAHGTITPVQEDDMPNFTDDTIKDKDGGKTSPEKVWNSLDEKVTAAMEDARIARENSEITLRELRAMGPSFFSTQLPDPDEPGRTYSYHDWVIWTGTNAKRGAGSAAIAASNTDPAAITAAVREGAASVDAQSIVDQLQISVKE